MYHREAYIAQFESSHALKLFEEMTISEFSRNLNVSYTVNIPSIIRFIKVTIFLIGALSTVQYNAPLHLG